MEAERVGPRSDHDRICALEKQTGELKKALADLEGKLRRVSLWTGSIA